MSNSLCLDLGDSHLSIHFFVCFQDTYDPKYMVSFQFRGSCFSLAAYGHLLFLRYMISCHLSSVPISLLIPSYLSIETSGDSVSTISVDLIVL